MGGYLRPLLFPKHLVLPPSNSWHQKPFWGSNLSTDRELITILEASFLKKHFYFAYTLKYILCILYGSFTRKSGKWRKSGKLQNVCPLTHKQRSDWQMSAVTDMVWFDKHSETHQWSLTALSKMWYKICVSVCIGSFTKQ